jgi:membrane protease YdiL (CAAX protease family)
MSLVFTHFFLRGEAVSWSEFLDLGHPNLRRALLMGCITGILVVPGALLFNAVSEILLTMLQGQPETQPTVQVLQLTVTVGQRVCFAFAAIVLAPICEEILFRGILYRVLKQFGWPRVALVASSLFFGLIHGNPMTLIPLSFLAVVLALLYDQTDNLMAPIVAHALFNAVNFSTFFLFPK